eukprot:363906-Chlamydomonas_euryale.AAC.5
MVTRMNGCMYGHTDGWRDRWMDTRTDGGTDGWRDRWMDKRMDGWMDPISHSFTLCPVPAPILTIHTSPPNPAHPLHRVGERTTSAPPQFPDLPPANLPPQPPPHIHTSTRLPQPASPAAPRERMTPAPLTASTPLVHWQRPAPKAGEAPWRRPYRHPHRRLRPCWYRPLQRRRHHRPLLRLCRRLLRRLCRRPLRRRRRRPTIPRLSGRAASS